MSDAIDIQGGLLSRDFLERLRLGDVPGGKAGDYDVAGRLEDRITAAWNELRNAWDQFKLKRSLQKSPSPEDAYAVTRDAWARFIFDSLRYTVTEEKRPLKIEDKDYPIRFTAQGVPIHVVPYTQDLDVGPSGTARGNPHSLLQEYLNRTKSDAWGIVTNGREWRILRNNAASTRASFISFDLEAVMERFDEFTLWWRIAHASRIIPRAEETPWLERWMLEAERQGTRALDALQKGVEAAIEALGSGFLKHPRNTALIGRLQRGELPSQDYYHQVLRLVYRLIFLFVTEERGLLLDPKAPAAARDLYVQHYSASRLLELSTTTGGSQHHDLFEGLKVVITGLKDSKGQPGLALPPLNSALWSAAFVPDLDSASIRNIHFLRALRNLARVQSEGVTRKVDYGKLGAEELGGIYESLLELNASVDPVSRRFSLVVAVGHERKTTSSYYTQTGLVDLALDQALTPVLTAIPDGPDAEQQLLALKVCDPTCGSGHFLIGAAHRIAKRLATARTGEAEPPRTVVLHALRDVISHCIYGVDLNEMAVELCKVSLWLEAMEPGKPLAFLDHRIRNGNAFFGAFPVSVATGLPDATFEVLSGDDAEVCGELRRKNREELETLEKNVRLTAYLEPSKELARLLREIDEVPCESISDIQKKEELHRRLLESDEAFRLQMAADAWCAAWTQPKIRPAHRDGAQAERHQGLITTATVVACLDNIEGVNRPTRAAITAQSTFANNRFLHWNLAFPDVFSDLRGPPAAATGWSGGFDVVVGNPPWDRIRMQDKEWFAARRPEIATTGSADKRRTMIAALASTDPALFQEYSTLEHWSQATSNWALKSGQNPTCGVGTINTAYVLAERYTQLVRPTGRVALITPLGLVSDFYTREFFQEIVRHKRLTAVLGFENEEYLFPGVAHNQKFCVLGVAGSAQTVESPIFSFYARQPHQAMEPTRCFALTPGQIQAINPNSQTCPIFRWPRDAIISGELYAQNPILKPDLGDDLWDVDLLRLFDMSTDSALFMTSEELEQAGYRREGMTWQNDAQVMWPAWEGKMVDVYDHRESDIVYVAENPTRPQQMKAIPLNEKKNPGRQPEPYQWGPAAEATARVPPHWKHRWYPVIKRVSAATNERTFVGCILPEGATSYTLYPIVSSKNPARRLVCLLANLLSAPADYLVRQKTTQPSLPKGVIHETAVVAPHAYDAPTPWCPTQTLEGWIVERVVELSYNSHSLQAFAADMGHVGPPYPWDPARRLDLMAQLHACFFHLYGVRRADAEYILDGFWAWRNRETKEQGEFISKRLTLHYYDAYASPGGQPNLPVMQDARQGSAGSNRSSNHHQDSQPDPLVKPAKGQQTLAGARQARL